MEHEVGPGGTVVNPMGAACAPILLSGSAPAPDRLFSHGFFVSHQLQARFLSRGMGFSLSTVASLTYWDAVSVGFMFISSYFFMFVIFEPLFVINVVVICQVV